jgi:predicted GIY-YIG superfamily endonuclease
MPPEPHSKLDTPAPGYELRIHTPDYWWSRKGLWHADDAAIEPDQSCVYWFFSTGDLLLYVGATQGPHRRWQQHANSKPWFREVFRIEQLVVPSHGIALQMEDEAIRVDRPLYNRTGPWNKQRKTVQRRGLPSVLDEVSSALGLPA